MTSTLLPPPRTYFEVTDPDRPSRGLCGTCGVDVTFQPCDQHGPASVDLADVSPQAQRLALVAQHIIHSSEVNIAATARLLSVDRDSAIRVLDNLETNWKIIGRVGPHAHRRVLIHPSHADRVWGIITANLGVPPTSNPFKHLLTPPLNSRDRRHAALIAQGLTNGQIARRMQVSLQTIKTHNGRLFRLVSTGDRTNFVHRCHLLGVFGGIPRQETDSNA